jgi:hypothetical protein
VHGWRREESEMATSITTFHGRHTGPSLLGQWFGEVRTFFVDLVEDLRSTPRQIQGLSQSDLFRNHLNALAISYFALIVLLLMGSLPVLMYLTQY